MGGSSWGSALLPWVMMANVAVTVIAIALFRIFMAGQWAQQQTQQGKDVRQLTERLSEEIHELSVQIAQLTIRLAVFDERLKHLERGGAGRATNRDH